MAPASSKPKSRNAKENNGPKFNKASKKPFKAKKKDDVPSEAVALNLEDDVPDFPRGGGSMLSRREREEIHAEADAEFEAEELFQKKKTKKGKKFQNRSRTEDDDLGSLFSDGLTGKLPRFANRITLKNICPGMKLWGVVMEVNEKDLVIGLPGGLRGLVRSADAVDPILDGVSEGGEHNLATSFFVGKLVPCVVLQLDDDKKDKSKRKIWLSLRLSSLHEGFTLDAIQEGMVLAAYVKSIEDHGYILHFGLSSFTGFLPKSSLSDSEVKAGQILQGVVRKIDKTRKIVYLNSDADVVSKCVMKDFRGISIDLLVPGMMVSARVQATLENGIMLSFLTYFTGTADTFHLQNSFPTSDWKDDYSKNKKVNARILFIDPSTRAIGLTLNHHLVHNKAPPSLVKVGDIYDSAKVVRVDKGLGLLLEISSPPVSTPAYVNVSDVAEDEVRKLEKKFKEGSKVRVRILGFKHLEGLATGMLKASAFEGAVFTHSDVKPGMVVRAKIIAVDSFGAIVQFHGGVKALCPLRHMSEFEIAKPRKKFKVGSELSFRVLGCKSKRITVTHKKTLVKSKLPILCSYADATIGLITHGWITKIEKHGCFVHFYSGVQGFVPRSELGLEPGTDASTIYHVGEVVKCRVLSSHPASHRINLSFKMKSSRVSEEEDVKLGCLLSGVVENVTPYGVIVYVNAKGFLKGVISTEHLADHQEQAAMLKSVLKPGYEFDQLLVLDIESNKLVLSAKYSLINSAHQLPSDISLINPQSIIHGYICNLIETGCFVRFLGRLTGFSPRSKAMDDQRAQLSEAFYLGQSVRSSILDVNAETNRITLSLKQSSCASTDASFLQGYFLLEDKIARLQLSESGGSEIKWVEGFKIGSTVDGKITESQEFGVVVTFPEYDDVFGFISHYQLGGTMAESGCIIRAAVLDVTKTERLVDLSLKPELLDRPRVETSTNNTGKKKRKREAYKNLDLHKSVNAVVEIVKDNYLVLSIPEHDYAIGYASLSDYNTQKFPRKQFVNGQRVVATVMDLPSPSTAGRLLLLLKSLSEITDSSSSKKAKKKSSYTVGSLVSAEITEKKPLEMRLKFGIGFHGRIHITEVNNTSSLEDPFKSFKVGETLNARIVGKCGGPDSKKSQLWELSIKPNSLADFPDLENNLMSEVLDFTPGQSVNGYVYKVDSEWVWLTISRHVKAQLFILDSSFEPSELQEFQNRFYVGKAVSGYVLRYNKEKMSLRLVLRALCLDCETKNEDGDQNKMVAANDSTHIHEGDVVGGRISKIFPGVGGLLVQLGPHLYGRVHYTELQDSWVPNPVSGYQEGQFVKCKVLEIGHSVRGTIHVDLSLRLSLDGMLSQFSAELPDTVENHSERFIKIEDLHPNKDVQGYVKNITSKGCFIMLSRKLDAKVLISNLSDGFIENPEKEFPAGKLVSGRVLSVEPLSQRVEVTLKKSSGPAKSEIYDLSNLHVGDIISGKIKRVESYGLFITLDHTNLVGLCHISELSDDRIENIEAKYKAGEKVKAKILKVDEERHRISLGMKNLDIVEDNPVSEESDEVGNDSINESDSELEGDMLDNDPISERVESRSASTPLGVVLDDMEQVSPDVEVVHNEKQNDEIDIQDEKNSRRAKKKAKEEREREINEAEQKLLEKDVPETADEFEKLVRTSPNSSFVWIKYMALMLSLNDIDKARSIAERALREINYREEKEKLNIWVAYFNLENQYGNPPEEAVKKVFQTALQTCDPEKVHLALLDMYERTEQHRLANELLEKMVKKFKHSCEVWLRRVQALLKQQEDGVQSVVQRALVCLPHQEHINFISQTAILEFKCGVPDRGRSMFEGVLREFPKRTDLWSVYLDQEIKLGDVDVIRALFERATSLSLPPKKIKFLFKKFLEFEKSLGDEQRVGYVKQKAMEYVENTME